MAEAPLYFQIHVLIGLALFALWPFTRLVHAFSAPIGYLFRPYIVYRSREVAADERTGGVAPAAPGLVTVGVSARPTRRVRRRRRPSDGDASTWRFCRPGPSHAQRQAPGTSHRRWRSTVSASGRSGWRTTDTGRRAAGAPETRATAAARCSRSRRPTRSRRRTALRRGARSPAGGSGFRRDRRPGGRRRLLVEHGCRSMCCARHCKADSPYTHAVAAVCETLPAATDSDVGGRSGWRRPVPPPNRLVCNRLR